MATIQKLLNSLTSEMSKQECCIKYQECLARIQKDEELYRKLNEFRKRNVELHYNKQTLKEEAILEREFHDLMNEEVIHEFLYWEQEMLKLLREIHSKVDESMKLDYSFLS